MWARGVGGERPPAGAGARGSRLAGELGRASWPGGRAAGRVRARRGGTGRGGACAVASRGDAGVAVPSRLAGLQASLSARFSSPRPPRWSSPSRPRPSLEPPCLRAAESHRVCTPSFFRSFIRNRSLNAYEVPGTGRGSEDAVVSQSRRGLPSCLLQSSTLGSGKYSGIARSFIYLIAFSLLHLLRIFYVLCTFTSCFIHVCLRISVERRRRIL